MPADRPPSAQVDDMPAALPSMWRAVKRGYDAEPALIAIAFALSLLAALPDALMPLLLLLLANGLEDGAPTMVLLGALGLALAAALTWVLRIVSDRTQRRFRDRVAIALESHVADLQASVATVEHHERPDYLDRLSILRNQVFVLDHMYMALFSTCGWILRLAVATGLLMSVHPALALLLAFALPTVVTSSWRPAVERAAEQAGAQAERLSRHLFDTATTAPPGKEVRVAGIGQRLIRDRRAAWQRWYAGVAKARWQSAIWHTLGWATFGAGYVAAVVFVAYVLDGSAGAVLLVLAAGGRLSAYISATVGEIGFLRGIWMDGSKRMAWLEDYAAAKAESADQPAPDALARGISLRDVCFAYPGANGVSDASKMVLKDINLDLPAGAVVALVGENGAGKTTLVKLLAKMYEPVSGSILVDGRDLSRIAAGEWRGRLAGAFQDFFRFEFRAARTVGIGDSPRMDETEAVATAVRRAGANDVVQALREGLQTQLGPTWTNGVEVSFGQWQKLSLARGFMRDEPLLLVLDEPTAALDAETEHALFERYARAARGGGHTPANGRITLLVSHRFSTVRMADLIVVMDGARVVESGGHEALMAAGGQYAELYGIQAAAYR